jgi:putative NIF3 family GTP cyclohydrolase 1 type 2
MSRLSRRQFALMAGAGLAAGKLALAQQGKLTAGEVVARIKKNIGIPWNDSTYRDLYRIGGPGSAVAGICTTFGTNLNLMQRSVKAGMNMIITHEPTFWTDADVVPPGGPSGGTQCDLACQADPLYKTKLDYAISNKIVVWRIHDHIHRMVPDGISLGLNARLNWTQYQVDGNLERWNIPPTTLGELAKYVAKVLDTRSVRVIGDPNLRVVKVGFGRNLGSMAADVNCIIGSDAREYDTFEYVRDAVHSGAQKGAIYVAHEAHEDPGMEWFAQWLKPFVPEVPVQYISTTDEFWTV